MPVPFIDLGRVTREFASDVVADWAECLAKTEFVGGPRVAKLESELCRVLGVANTVTCANGTDALSIALKAMGVKAGQRVAIPNLTFWATYEAVENIGARPVLIDIDPDDLQMSYDELVRAHDELRFEAAIFVHLYGWTSARLGDIRSFCRERGVKLLEDGAQCYGVEWRGKPLLEDADAATLSFYPAKVIGGAMDGGAMTFRSAEQAALARSLANHGRAQHYSYAHVGTNSRMGGIQAAFLNKLVAKSSEIVGNRRAAAARYRTLLANEKRIRHYGPPKDVNENGYLCVLTSPKHDGKTLEERLKAAGIGTARTYPETLDQQPPATGGIRFGGLARSREIVTRVVNLPLFYGITAEEQDASVAALARALD